MFSMLDLYLYTDLVRQIITAGWDLDYLQTDRELYVRDVEQWLSALTAGGCVGAGADSST